MRQYDVCRLRDGRDNLVVILQSDVIDELDTRVVAPLSTKPQRRLIADMRVPVELRQISYTLLVDRMAAIDKRSIGEVVGNIAGADRQIKNALDLMFFGI